MPVQMSPVGATARWIAAARALETESASPLFSDPYARALAGDDGFQMLDAMRLAMGPGAGGSGPDLFLSLRTRFLDDSLSAAVRDQNLRQVVILAAGMDTRAFRLVWPAATTVYELDRDDVFAVKEPVLTGFGARPRADRRTIHVDLSGDWVSRLLDAGFDSSQPAAFLTEGLLMYLEPDVADGVLRAISTLAADGSWIGLDGVNREMIESPYTAGYMQRLRDFGVPWHFGMPEPEILFARYGWRATVVAPGDPDANYGRWTFPTVPRSVPGIPRSFFIVASKGGAVAAGPQPIAATTAEHYVWGSVCDAWHLVKHDTVSVLEEEMPPGASEERHWHARARQFFYVLRGTLEMEVEGVVQTMAAGSGIEIPPGTAHRAANTAAEPVRFLLVSQPPAHGDREPA